jgi:RNase P subunit RPR2
MTTQAIYEMTLVCKNCGTPKLVKENESFLVFQNMVMGMTPHVFDMCDECKHHTAFQPIGLKVFFQED